jgi:hypothetical protein
MNSLLHFVKYSQHEIKFETKDADLNEVCILCHAPKFQCSESFMRKSLKLIVSFMYSRSYTGPVKGEVGRVLN